MRPFPPARTSLRRTSLAQTIARSFCAGMFLAHAVDAYFTS
jgi:hypothetical protein